MEEKWVDGNKKRQVIECVDVANELNQAESSAVKQSTTAFVAHIFGEAVFQCSVHVGLLSLP